MYIQYIIYNFSITIRVHVYVSWNINKQNKFEKIMQCLFIIYPLPFLWYGNGFSLKKDIIMH
jgi:hypothetical protein